MSTDAQKQAAVRFMDGVVSGAISDDLVTPDFSMWTARSGWLSGQEYRGRIAGLDGVFKVPLKLTVTDVVADGQQVAVFADGQSVLASGEDYNNNYVFLFKFEGHRIASAREYFDTQKVVDLLAPAIRAAKEKRQG